MFLEWTGVALDVRNTVRTSLTLIQLEAFHALRETFQPERIPWPDERSIMEQ